MSLTLYIWDEPRRSAGRRSAGRRSAGDEPRRSAVVLWCVGTVDTAIAAGQHSENCAHYTHLTPLEAGAYTASHLL